MYKSTFVGTAGSATLIPRSWEEYYSPMFQIIVLSVIWSQLWTMKCTMNQFQTLPGYGTGLLKNEQTNNHPQIEILCGSPGVQWRIPAHFQKVTDYMHCKGWGTCLPVFNVKIILTESWFLLQWKVRVCDWVHDLLQLSKTLPRYPISLSLHVESWALGWTTLQGSEQLDEQQPRFGKHQRKRILIMTPLRGPPMSPWDFSYANLPK